MSRIGKKPILIPASVEVTVEGNQLSVKGPKGTLSFAVHPLMLVTTEEGEVGRQIIVRPKDETEAIDALSRSLWGTTRACLANLIIGVTEGFKKQLEVIGVGYKVSVQGDKIVLDVGYSHDVEMVLPPGISASVDKNSIILTSSDNVALGQFAHRLRSVRRPEPYKGKGIKYVDEQIRRKAGKAAKTGA